MLTIFVLRSSVMRVIDITDPKQLKFVEVVDPSVARFAILSHVWNKQGSNSEPTFQDLLSAMKDSPSLPGPKWDKLRGFIRIASEGGYNLVWADMCCIDKTSSTEVSEAIASMYYWYLSAEVCYAYLKDVSSPPRKPNTLPLRPPPQFSQSIWFKRGWTLQELIASKSLIFFSSDWQFLGTKRGFSRVIQDITKIDARVLTHERKLHEVSVASRMSWAADRITTYIEDRAYSLMGLFGVRIYVLYGEREYAFIRLQEEILRRIPDPTLLAWGPQRYLSELPLHLSEHERIYPMEAAQTVHVRARQAQKFPPPVDWDPGYLLATSPEAFRRTANLTRSAPQPFGPVSIAPSRTVLRGGGPYKQNIIPFDMLRMKSPLIRSESRATHATDAQATVPQSYYLIPLGCETGQAESLALLLCPRDVTNEAPPSASAKDHLSWAIGGSFKNANGDAPYHCRIVALPSHNGDSQDESRGLLKRWTKALDVAPDREVYLPLSAPMDHWNAGDPRRAELLCGNQGRFQVHLSVWCKSTMEAAGFTFKLDGQAPGKNLGPAHVFTLFSPHTHRLYVKEGAHDVPVRAFEIAFASCPPHRPEGAENVFLPLVGSITPCFQYSDQSPATSTTPAEQPQCSSCPAAVADHLGTSGSSRLWSFYGGIAVRTLQCFIGPPREKSAANQHAGGSFMLSIVLRALLTPPGSQTTHQAYLLEIEFHAIEGTPSLGAPLSPGGNRRTRHPTTSDTEPATKKLKVTVPSASITLEPRTDMSPTSSAKPAPSPTRSGH